MDKCDVPTFYWLPKLHDILINHDLYQTLATALLRFFQSIYITSALTAVKDHVIKYSETAIRNRNVN